MALYFITGSSGSGKSSVTLALRDRGYEAYDTDDDAFARWQNKKTGYIHPKSSVKPEQRTPEFLAEHDWNVPRGYVEDLAGKAAKKTVFLCGAANNFADLRDLFAEVFALHIDADTLKNRLQNRKNNSWGKQPHELAQSLAENEEAEAKYQQLNWIIIDATRSLDKVLDDIVSRI